MGEYSRQITHVGIEPAGRIDAITGVSANLGLVVAILAAVPLRSLIKEMAGVAADAVYVKLPLIKGPNFTPPGKGK